MIIRKPDYYDTFRCIAGACPDSCCQEWDVLVDPESAAFYRSLPGDLGDRLRQVLVDTEDGTCMRIEDRRCPMWRQDGLCRIQAELGEEALCQVCSQFPRLTHDYGDFMEYGLELSCPEAARIILSSRNCELITRDVPGGETGDYEEDIMSILRRSRDTARRILWDPAWSLPQALRILLLYGYHIQAELDGEEELPFEPAGALAEAAQFAGAGDCRLLFRFFRQLEILTPHWQELLESEPEPGPWEDSLRAAADYFILRYWLQAVSDWDLVCRVKFMIISCLMIRNLPENRLRAAQLYSKEIENSMENVETILDSTQSHPALTDACLLGLLM